MQSCLRCTYGNVDGPPGCHVQCLTHEKILSLHSEELESEIEPTGSCPTGHCPCTSTHQTHEPALSCMHQWTSAVTPMHQGGSKQWLQEVQGSDIDLVQSQNILKGGLEGDAYCRS